MGVPIHSFGQQRRKSLPDCILFATDESIHQVE
jgi:hypothetical protein